MRLKIEVGYKTIAVIEIDSGDDARDNGIIADVLASLADHYGKAGGYGLVGAVGGNDD